MEPQLYSRINCDKHVATTESNTVVTVVS